MPRYVGLSLALAVLCGGGPAGASPATLPAAFAYGASLDVKERGHGRPQSSSFALPERPVGGIVAGTDARMWFGTYSRAGDISQHGKITMLAQDPVYAQLAGGFSRGPAGDKHLWYTAVDRIGEAAIARVTPPGTIELFRLSDPVSYVVGLAAGPDRALYGAGIDSIVRISTDGRSVTNYPLPPNGGPATAPAYVGRPMDIALGPDGAMWFTMPSTPYVGRFDPVSHLFNAYPIPARDAGSLTAFGDSLYMTAADPDGRSFVAKLHVGGGYTRIDMPGSGRHYLQSMAVGPDGNLWVGGAGLLWNVSPLGGVNGPYQLRGVSSGPNYLAAGPDGNLWCLDGVPQAVLVYELHALTVSATSLLLAIGDVAPLTATENAPAGRIAAYSFSNRVATVSTLGSGNFSITAVGAGRTTVRVYDAKHNFVDVPVSVSR